MRELVIAGRRIAEDEPCYVIAEIGNNHGGDVQTAADLIRAAADAGADAAKFQMRQNDTLYTHELLDKPYDNMHSFGRTYGEHRKAVELLPAAYFHVDDCAKERRIAWFLTPFDERSADTIATDFNPPAYKFASGALTDHALLAHVAKLGKPLILSTGGGTLREIDEALQTLFKHNTQVAVLHCTAAYPCHFEELNLRCIETLRERYPECVIGWSCHVHNISMVMAAYALGARIIETHFTLNRSMKGTDHAFSMEPATLKKLCKDLKRAHVALGDGVKRVYPSEIGPIAKMRRVQTPDGLRITGAPWTPSDPLSSASSRPF